MDKEILEKLAARGFYLYQIYWRVWSKETSEIDYGGTKIWEGFHASSAYAMTKDDAIEVARFLKDEASKLGYKYQIQVFDRTNGSRWVKEFDSTKMRVASPYHRVFIVVGGRDCDGIVWREYYSFKNLEEASEEVDKILSWADGPTSYTTLSLEDWEMGEYPEYRDEYAERMGY